MGRFPVTLYKGQWSELLNMSNEIRFYCCERSAVEGKRLCCGIVRWGVASVLFRAFKAYPDFVGNPPLEAARPHGFAVKGRLKSVGKTGASENSRRAPTDVISRT